MDIMVISYVHKIRLEKDKDKRKMLSAASHQLESDIIPSLRWEWQ